MERKMSFFKNVDVIDDVIRTKVFEETYFSLLHYELKYELNLTSSTQK